MPRLLHHISARYRMGQSGPSVCPPVYLNL